MPAHTLKVGDAEIIFLHDMPFAVPYEIFFPKVPREEIDAYEEHYPGSTSNGLFNTHASAYAIRSQDQTILCDTGFGPGPITFLNNATGELLDDMRAKGVDPSSVDVVVHTHLHGDHVGWNISPEGKPNFPNARHIAPQADWDYFMADLQNQAHMQQVMPLQEMGKLELVSGEVTINSEITTYPTPGHTPGHQSIMVSSGDDRVLITGDLAHHPAQVDRTDWCSAFDIDHRTTSDTRARMFAQLEADAVTVAFCHFPDAPFGRLVRLGTKRIWRALS